jgi:KipI family sensor histidine kinase inhibitor
MTPRFLSAGDRALAIDFGDRIDRELSERVLRLDAVLRARKVAGVVETVPTFRSLLVHFDPLTIGRASLEAAIRHLLVDTPARAAGARLWQVPVCYEADFAPDLAEVACRVGLDPTTFAARHSALRHHVYMLGFLPGFPYMGDLPEEFALPRRADPRVRVPAGSVAIATRLTAIYPFESPGGWHLIGTTPIPLFDAAAERPALLAPGDAVAIEPIDADRFAAIKALVAERRFVADSEPLGS